jgi:hypothetical protein
MVWETPGRERSTQKYAYGDPGFFLELNETLVGLRFQNVASIAYNL